MFCEKVCSVVSNIVSAPLRKVVPRMAELKDIAEISSAKISPIERELMEEVRKYSINNGVETARVIDKHGKLCEMETIEGPNSVYVMSKNSIKVCGCDLGILGKLIKKAVLEHKSTYIHSHTMNIPLSGNDVVYMLGGNVKKMFAVTPNGSFSCLELPKNLKKAQSVSKCLNGADEITKFQAQKFRELGIIPDTNGDYSKVSPEICEEYSKFSTELLQKFAQKYGFKFVQGQL